MRKRNEDDRRSNTQTNLRSRILKKRKKKERRKKERRKKERRKKKKKKKKKKKLESNFTCPKCADQKHRRIDLPEDSKCGLTRDKRE